MKKNINSIIILFMIVFIIFFINCNTVALEPILKDGYYNVFKGKIKGEHLIKMFLYNNEGKITGNYFYTKYQSKIELQGKMNKRKIILFEYNEKGQKIAKFIGKTNNKKITGTWNNLKANKQYKFEVKKTNHFWGTEKSIYADAGLENEKEVENFAKDLKNNILNKNKKEVAKVIEYPIEVKVKKKTRVIKSEKEFIKKFNKIFSKDYIKELEKASVINLTTHYIWGVMLGDEEKLWFNKPNGENELKVTAINN
ncbi:MAG: hypothetical protein ACQEQF_09570 [Bacillota bacterium]